MFYLTRSPDRQPFNLEYGQS